MAGSMPWADKPCPETALLLVDVLLLLLLMLLLLPVFLVCAAQADVSAANKLIIQVKSV